eukprot:4799673-Alexandrium_andersonii.AAC.1
MLQAAEGGPTRTPRERGRRKAMVATVATTAAVAAAARSLPLPSAPHQSLSQGGAGRAEIR